MLFFFFFFQAEDGIRDYKVTGVQTCALPIFPHGARRGLSGWAGERMLWSLERKMTAAPSPMMPESQAPGMSRLVAVGERSEERRVGKECRSRWSPYH